MPVMDKVKQERLELDNEANALSCVVTTYAGGSNQVQSSPEIMDSPSLPSTNSSSRRKKLYKCTLCSYTTNRKWNLYACHMKMHSRPLKGCMYCGFRTKHILSLKKHMLNKHPNVDTNCLDEHTVTMASDPTYVSNENTNSSSSSSASNSCAMVFSEPHPLVTALPVRAVSPQEAGIGTSSSISKDACQRNNFMCSHCDIVYFDQALYFLHMGLHTPGDPWRCQVCSQLFHDVYGFTSHLINH